MNPTIMCWKCWEAASTNIWVHLRSLVIVYKPNILVLVETKVHSDRARPFLESLNFVDFITVEASGFMGGI